VSVEDILAKMREAARSWEDFLAAQYVYLEVLRAMGLVPRLRQETANTEDVQVLVTSADLVI